jgi:putative protease
MTIHNAAGVQWAAEQGFARVVLARELSLEEVRTIAEETKDTGVGLEVFIHGALCYGYSGQCLLSSVIGGRSGNRGMCAQPCRKPWTLVAGTADEYGRPVRMQDVPARDRYLLSPKDLCTYRHLVELVQSPIASLKIEGRMKSPEYVAIVVATYRQALDAIATGTWMPSDTAEQDLSLAFNREFTDGYLFGHRHERLMGRDAPDNRGLRIGTVIRFDAAQFRAIIRPDGKYVPEPGDGLLIAHPDAGGETGFALNIRPVLMNGEIQVRVPRPVPPGSTVFITSSRELDARARQIAAKTGPGLHHPLPVDMTAVVNSEGLLVVSGSVERPDGRIVPITTRPEAILVPAESRPLSREMIARQLEKSGGTPFVVRSLLLDYNGTLFAPLAEINRLRREFFTATTEQLVDSYCPAIQEVQRIQHRWRVEAPRYPTRAPDSGTPTVPGPLRLGLYADTTEGVREAAVAGVDIICFEPYVIHPPNSCGQGGIFISPLPQLEEALAICHNHRTELVWKFPGITHDRYLHDMTRLLPVLENAGLAGCMVDNPGTARAVRAACPAIPILGSMGLNIFNHAAVTAAAPLFSRVTLSPELSRDDIALLRANLAARKISTECALVVQGTTDALVSADCLKKLLAPCGRQEMDTSISRKFLGIRDDSGQVYPVRGAGTCSTRIGNCSELCLIEYLPVLRTLGIAEIVIDARHRPPAYIRTICRIYRSAGSGSSPQPADSRRSGFIPSLKNEIDRVALGGITTGHFIRGLKE